MVRSKFRTKCAAILFDMDGVLVDSSAVIERSWLRWARKNKIDESELMTLIHGRKAIDTLRLVAPNLDEQKELSTLVEQELHDDEGPKIFHGVVNILASLPSGRWAVVTSAPRKIALGRFFRGGLPVPEVLICAEDVTDGKPSPEGYLKAGAALNVSPAECVVVEDSLPGIQAGHAAGMSVLGIATPKGPPLQGSPNWVIDQISKLHIQDDSDGLSLFF